MEEAWSQADSYVRRKELQCMTFSPSSAACKAVLYAADKGLMPLSMWGVCAYVRSYRLAAILRSVLKLASCLKVGEIMCWLLCPIVDHERMVRGFTAWGVRWTGLPHSLKTDGDRLFKGNLSRYCLKTFEMANCSDSAHHPFMINSCMQQSTYSFINSHSRAE